MARPASGFDTLSRELMQERTSALSISMDRLEAALDALAATAPGSAAWERNHREAQRLLWNLVVHRESLGLRRHETVYEVLAIPSSVQPVWTPE